MLERIRSKYIATPACFAHTHTHGVITWWLITFPECCTNPPGWPYNNDTHQITRYLTKIRMNFPTFPSWKLPILSTTESNRNRLRPPRPMPSPADTCVYISTSGLIKLMIAVGSIIGVLAMLRYRSILKPPATTAPIPAVWNKQNRSNTSVLLLCLSLKC